MAHRTWILPTPLLLISNPLLGETGRPAVDHAAVEIIEADDRVSFEAVHGAHIGGGA